MERVGECMDGWVDEGTDVLRAKNLSSESTATALTRRIDTMHLVSDMSAD